MELKKVNCVVLMVSLRDKSLSYFYHPAKNGGGTSGRGGWICLQKRAKYSHFKLCYSMKVRIKSTLLQMFMLTFKITVTNNKVTDYIASRKVKLNCKIIKETDELTDRHCGCIHQACRSTGDD